MQISEKGINLIKEFEGLYLKAYYDAVGVISIGYGITNSDKAITGVTIRPGMKISKETAEKWLRDSLNKKYAPKVMKYDSKYLWNQNQFDALVSFAYNVGSIDQLTANGTRDINTIARKILAYNKAGGKVLTGLARRRKAEHDLFCTPVSNKTSKKPAVSTDEGDYDMPTIKKGSKGKAVCIWQIVLGLTADGIFGDKTVDATKTFQKKHYLTVDGIVGKNTWIAGMKTLYDSL